MLGIFYVVYINANAYHKNNTKDENDIIQNCTCAPGHRNFYLAWSIICWGFWLIFHCCLAIPQFKTYFCIKTMPDKNQLPCCSIRLLHWYKQSQSSQNDSQPSKGESSSNEIQPSVDREIIGDKNQEGAEKSKQTVDERSPTDKADIEASSFGGYHSCCYNCFSVKYQSTKEHLLQQQQPQQAEILDEVSCCCLSVNNQALIHENQNSFDEISCCCCSFGCLQLDSHRSKESKTRNFYCCGKQCAFKKICCCSKDSCENCCLNLYKTVKEMLIGCCYYCCCCQNVVKSFTKLRKMMFEHTNIHQYEGYLWTKYYELYVVGTAKDDEAITLKSVDEFIKIKSSTKDVIDGDVPKGKKNSDGEKQKPSKEKSHYTNALSDSIEHHCYYIIQVVFHLILFIFQFVAQLLIIPLFTLQIFDN